ncbi:MAG: amino acid ABC transporter substrate-binding protein [Prochloraceae cyanobacterium]
MLPKSLLLISLVTSTFLTSCYEQQAIVTQTPSSSSENTKTESSETNETESRLELVKKRQRLICGINGRLPGLSYKDKNGNYSGLDVDICRAVAAALFNDPDAVEYRSLGSNERFTAVSLGKIDLLSRNTTWTLKRDAVFDVDFASIVFYDGQGIMVRQDSGITKFEDLNNKSICVATGTTNELNLYDEMRRKGINFTPVKYLDEFNVFKGYRERRCEAFSSDRSQLLARKFSFENPNQHLILEDTISKEPLGPAIIDNDSEWLAVVRWITYALIEAEELGINSTNLEEMKQSENPQIRRFLGLEGNLGRSLGLSKDFTQHIIYHVGNYGEIYERNLGEKSPFKLPRGLNDLWKNGGLLYSPPFR